MRSIKTEGIIIKRKNVGEADRLLTVFTRELGKISIKATGVRRITSRRSSHTELLNLSSLYLYKGKSIYTLTEAQTIENFTNLKDKLITIGFAYHICELIDGLCAENQENERVFRLFKNILFDLSQCYLASSSDILLKVHDFEVELLIELGFWRISDKIPNRIVNTHSIIENLLERKLKSKQILHQIK